MSAPDLDYPGMGPGYFKARTRSLRRAGADPEDDETWQQPDYGAEHEPDLSELTDHAGD